MKDNGFDTSTEGLTPFYRVEDVPANSVLLMRSKERAKQIARGDIELVFCPDSGFVTNRAFDDELVQYSAEYEETQGFSGTFSAFHKQLAQDLIERYDLADKTILEIGCGKGEFLTLLCEMGGNRGIGFDPAYRPERNDSEAKERITFIQDFYSEEYAHYTGDFVCCKMTLEHIPNVVEFVGMVRRAIGDAPDTVVFFQVPEMRRVLKDLAFWDVYHEHCSYFTPGSLARLFRSQGFDVLNLWTDYDDQYLMIEARPHTEKSDTPGPHSLEESPEELAKDVGFFAENISNRLEGWRALLSDASEEGQRVVLWGGGSKAVAFLTTLGLEEEVIGAVDINPYKQGTYLAGTGHEIIVPEDLKDIQPDVVIIMNPIYHDEIQSDLLGMGLSPAIWHIDEDPREIESMLAWK